MRAALASGLALAMTLAACVTTPREPFAAAEAARARGDLAAALAGYDRVPVEHPHYAEARSAVVGVERSMRRAHELLLAGIQLRNECREAEALERLRLAQAEWPSLPGVEHLIASTESRIALFGPRAATELAVARVEVPAAAPSGPTAPTPAGEPEVAPPIRPEVSPPSTAAPPAVLDPALTPELAGIEEQIQQGRIEPAMAALVAMVTQAPQDPRAGNRLVPLLHQRALLRYGQGEVAAAVADWREALALRADPLMRRMLAAAEAELAASRSRQPGRR